MAKGVDGDADELVPGFLAGEREGSQAPSRTNAVCTSALRAIWPASMHPQADAVSVVRFSRQSARSFVHSSFTDRATAPDSADHRAGDR